MSRIMVDDGIIGGERINPPEYESDDPECGACGRFLEVEFDTHVEMADGSLRCVDCRKMCECGEWILDESKAVNIRNAYMGTRQLWHPACAAEWLMEEFEK